MRDQVGRESERARERGAGTMSDEEQKEEKELDLTSPDVVTKYKCAAEIANSEFCELHLQCRRESDVVDKIYVVIGEMREIVDCLEATVSRLLRSHPD